MKLICFLLSMAVFGFNPNSAPKGSVITVVTDDTNNCVRTQPNPSTNGIVTFVAQKNEDEIQTVKVFDLNGNLVFSSNCNATNCTIDFNPLANGLFKIEVQTHDCSMSGMLSSRD